ncbi:hypothetical protein ACFRI7_29770 [Streptomyces sp. NPDC056716]|uniref:hypothetical protein n=1 Tax=unclassified Streptomyces TaxID=2593676 RepID=UPI0036BBB94D
MTAATAIDQLLARARLHPHPDVPDDAHPGDATRHPGPPSGVVVHDGSDAQYLRILCETAIGTVRHSTLDFLTDQIPDLHSAWLLGCALHVAGIEDGARFWWQYAAGDGHPPACHTLSLYHQIRGEQHAADFYRHQAHEAHQAQQDPVLADQGTDTLTVAGVSPPHQIRFDASLPTVLRTLSRLTTGPGARPRRHRIDALTRYVADTVTRHYTRHPGVEIPVPEPHFADRVTWLLTATLPWPGLQRSPHSRPAPPLPARRPAHRSGSGCTTTA